MKRKIVEYPLSLVFIIGSLVLVISLFFLSAFGVLAGLLVEILKFKSRAVNSKRRSTEYKMPKPIMEVKQNGKATKIFKLPLPENIQGERMVYIREK